MSEASAKIAGVVGDPISHSLSPKLHRYWLRKYGVTGDYAAFHVAKNELADFIARLKSNKIEGVNLTVPHKESAMALVDELDASAKKIGAVNTIYFDERGKMIGANTDGYGFLKHLKQTTQSWAAEKGPVTIIGAGGAARAVIISLLDEGVPEIRLVNRTLERATSLANEIADSRIKVIPWRDREDALLNAELLVNVTTLGMTGQPALELSLDNLPIKATVYDIVYSPLETDLLKRARERGNETVDGLGMLLHQAVPGFKAWFGVMPEVDQGLRDHLLEALK
tara:strand:+ start:2039 stop:2884 length:846 start_codon:yes stop_codon:yes gene_type:complete